MRPTFIHRSGQISSLNFPKTPARTTLVRPWHSLRHLFDEKVTGAARVANQAAVIGHIPARDDSAGDVENAA